MIEVLIIAALLGVMITTFASYQYQRARQNRVRETHTTFTQLQGNLKNSIGQSESLTQAEDQQYATLATPTPPVAPAPTTADATPKPACPTDCTPGADGVCEQSNQNCYQDDSCVVGCRINGIPTNGGSLPGGGGGNGGNVGGNVNGGNGNGGNGGGVVNGGGNNGGNVNGVLPTATPCVELPGCGVTVNGVTGACHCIQNDDGGTSAGSACKSGMPPSGSCDSTPSQCVMNQSSYPCHASPTRMGQQYCGCPGVYIYPNPVCPATPGYPAVQCYLK